MQDFLFKLVLGYRCLGLLIKVESNCWDQGFRKSSFFLDFFGFEWGIWEKYFFGSY